MRALVPLLLTVATCAGCVVDGTTLLPELPPPVETPAPAPAEPALENLPLVANLSVASTALPLSDSNWAIARTDRELTDDFTAVLQDHADYYSFENLRLVGLGVALAAPVANSPLDGQVRHWYQEAVHTASAERWGTYIRNGGEYTYTLPAYFGTVVMATVLKAGEDAETPSFAGEVGDVLDEWGRRCLRAMAVGAPPVGVLQLVLGSPRPGPAGSDWQPFANSTGVSGHAFVGSVPFVTAAWMTDDPLLRSALFLASFVVAWSRIQLDAHYFSQAALGWWMGYLAASRVSGAPLGGPTWGRWQFVPGCSEGPGVSVVVDY